MLEVEGIVAGYGATQILRGVSLTVAAGETVAVLGANGAGKTTLNKVLSGILRARAGSVRLDGRRIDGSAPRRIVAAGVVHVPEGRRIFPNLTVEDNLVLGSYARAKPRRKENLAKAYDLFPRLKERRSQLAGTLSGGEQQMLAIGRGLMGEPRLLLLDEPSLGLSPRLVEELFALVERIAASGLGVLLVEQNVVQSLEIAARAYVIENGAIVLEGRAQDLLRDPRLERAYLGL
jgi:branched-chain amino acid transport system ATP-binding protein